MNEMTKPEQMTFELDLPAGVEERCDERHRLAQTHIAAGCWHWVEAGKQYAANKNDLKGQWAAWCGKQNVVLQTVDTLIRIAQSFGDKLNPQVQSDVGMMDFGALRLLASPSVPQEARDEAMSRAMDGEHITKADAEEMVAQAVAASVAEAIAEAEANQQEAIEAAIAEATEELADDKEALEAEIKKIRAEARKKTDLPKLVDTACRLLKIKKLTGLQYHHLAQLLGQAISVNGTRYLPLSSEQIKENEDRMRVASTVSEAVGVLAGAPPPAALLAVCYPVQRLRIAQRMDAVIAWATECREAVKAWEGEEV